MIDCRLNDKNVLNLTISRANTSYYTVTPIDCRKVDNLYPKGDMPEEGMIEPMAPWKFSQLKVELSRTERHILKEMNFVCQLKLGISAVLRTTLCVRFRSEVVACGVVYATAPFDADKSIIDKVCRVLAHLYSLPKAQYISVCKDGKPFTFSSRSANSQAHSATKLSCNPRIRISELRVIATRKHACLACIADRSDVQQRLHWTMPFRSDSVYRPVIKIQELQMERETDREKEPGRKRARLRSHRGRDPDKEGDRERDKLKNQSHHRSDISRHHYSRYCDYCKYSYTLKDRRRHH
ncbi:hypothetical protein EUTSA_v10001260mg [Eutrema salsugineum]|uniref:Uncharacterized protein n=1 Tax=Eutrema salsugineum TaxID=72664 RepID=V4LAQ9_EUTSA|nr:hypothetical protein EUTSA_v10001260mg [Eutrema salsugineum]